MKNITLAEACPSFSYLVKTNSKSKSDIAHEISLHVGLHGYVYNTIQKIPKKLIVVTKKSNTDLLILFEYTLWYQKYEIKGIRGE